MDLFTDEQGQSLVEYSLILVLMVLVAVFALSLVGLQVKTAYYDKINNVFPP